MDTTALGLVVLDYDDETAHSILDQMLDVSTKMDSYRYKALFTQTIQVLAFH